MGGKYNASQKRALRNEANNARSHDSKCKIRMQRKMRRKRNLEGLLKFLDRARMY